MLVLDGDPVGCHFSDTVGRRAVYAIGPTLQIVPEEDEECPRDHGDGNPSSVGPAHLQARFVLDHHGEDGVIDVRGHRVVHRAGGFITVADFVVVESQPVHGVGCADLRTSLSRVKSAAHADRSSSPRTARCSKSAAHCPNGSW